MQQVQDRLDFTIDTPDDDELRRIHDVDHQMDALNRLSTSDKARTSKSYCSLTKNQKKRARKAQRKVKA